MAVAGGAVGTIQTRRRGAAMGREGWVGLRLAGAIAAAVAAVFLSAGPVQATSCKEENCTAVWETYNTSRADCIDDDQLSFNEHKFCCDAEKTSTQFIIGCCLALVVRQPPFNKHYHFHIANSPEAREACAIPMSAVLRNAPLPFQRSCIVDTRGAVNHKGRPQVTLFPQYLLTWSVSRTPNHRGPPVSRSDSPTCTWPTTASTRLPSMRIAQNGNIINPSQPTHLLPENCMQLNRS